MSFVPDVVVVGAGPAGSAAAAHLARAGCRVTLVERAAFPREKACSEYLSPEAVRLLDRLGLTGELEQAGAQPLFGTRVYGPRGAALTGRFSSAPVPPFRDAGLALPRRILDRAIAEAAVRAGAELRERVVVEELLYEEGAVAGVALRRADGGRELLRARLVIGADGLRSVVARRLGASRSAGSARRRFGPFPSRIAFVAHVADVPGLDGFAEMHVSEARYVGLNRIGDGLANVALVVPARLAAAAKGRIEEFFFASLNRFPGVRDRVDPRRVTRRIMVTGPFAARARKIVADGVLLVGDAADFFDPFTGEGITSALRGAELAAAASLAALESDRHPSARALAPYLRARRDAFLGKWIVERLVGYGMLAPRLFDRAVARLERRGLAHTFIGVTGDYVPASTALHPWFLARMLL
jgi:flavin-dependent dehydrogenase